MWSLLFNTTKNTLFAHDMEATVQVRLRLSFPTV